MSHDLILKIRLFGAFRNLSPLKEIELKLIEKTTVAEVKIELGSILKKTHPHFDVAGLLSRSVLANDSRILNESEWVQDEVSLSILPPVCGG